MFNKRLRGYPVATHVAVDVVEFAETIRILSAFYFVEIMQEFIDSRE